MCKAFTVVNCSPVIGIVIANNKLVNVLDAMFYHVKCLYLFFGPLIGSLPGVLLLSLSLLTSNRIEAVPVVLQKNKNKNKKNNKPPRKSEPCSEFLQLSIFSRGWCEASAAVQHLQLWFLILIIKSIFFSTGFGCCCQKCVCPGLGYYLCQVYVSLVETQLFTSTVLKYRRPVQKIEHFFVIKLFSFITAFQVNWHQCFTSRLIWAQQMAETHSWSLCLLASLNLCFTILCCCYICCSSVLLQTNWILFW